MSTDENRIEPEIEPPQRHKDDFEIFTFANFFRVGCLVFLGLFLFALIRPGFTGARIQARERACYANMRVIMSAIEQYNLDWPRTISFSPQPAPIAKLVRSQYLKTPPTCPLSPGAGNAYRLAPKFGSGGAPRLDQDVTVGEAAPGPDDGVVVCPDHGTLD